MRLLRYEESKFHGTPDFSGRFAGPAGLDPSGYGFGCGTVGHCAMRGFFKKKWFAQVLGA